MANRLTIVTIAACALALAACGRDVGSETAAKPTEAPLQTGEVGAKSGSSETGSEAAGGGTTTGARTTPNPK